jgi:hypothetical protein
MRRLRQQHYWILVKTALRQASMAMAGRCHTGVRCQHEHVVIAERRRASSKACVARVLFPFPFLSLHSTVLATRELMLPAASSQTGLSTRASLADQIPSVGKRSVTVTVASNHVQSFPVPSNQHGNGRTPPGALTNSQTMGALPSATSHVKFGIPPSANEAAAEALQCSTLRETEPDERKRNPE